MSNDLWKQRVESNPAQAHLDNALGIVRVNIEPREESNEQRGNRYGKYDGARPSFLNR